MKVRQHANYYQNFGAKLGTRAVFYLKDTPEKLDVLKRNFACMGEPTTVVDIMSRETKKENSILCVFLMRFLAHNTAEHC